MSLILTTAQRVDLEASNRDDDRKVFYRPELDCLRFFAFLAVWIHHYLPKRPDAWAGKGVSFPLARLAAYSVEAGALGVDLFFVLSAYLITELLLREHAANGALDVRSFYVRRILRIWPLYFGFLALISCFPAYRLSPTYLFAFLLLAGNWVIALRGYPSSPAALLWSVSIEEQFYLTWPVLLTIIGVRRLKTACFALLALAVAMRFLLVARNAVNPAIWCNTFTRLDPIVAGALLAIGLRGRLPKLKPFSRVALVGGGCLAIVLVAQVATFEGPTSLILYPVSALSCAGIVFGTLGARTGGGPAVRFLIYLGKISYGLYVFHMLTNAIFADRLSMFGGMTRGVILLAINIVLASLSYQFYEKPFLRLKDRFAVIRKSVPASPQAVTM